MTDEGKKITIYKVQVNYNSGIQMCGWFNDFKIDKGRGFLDGEISWERYKDISPVNVWPLDINAKAIESVWVIEEKVVTIYE